MRNIADAVRAATPAPAPEGVDYLAYLKTDEWAERAAACIAAAGHRCAVCNGRTRLEAHHRTYERLGNERPDDLTCLCRRCHGAVSVLEWVPGGGRPPQSNLDKVLAELAARKGRNAHR